jgi:hypothetical protein
MSPAEIHYATPGAGWRLVRHIAIVAVAGAALLAIAQAYQPALVEWASSDPARMRARAQMLIAIIAVILLGPLAGFATYLWRLGTRTLNEERFPPEGLKVIRDVLVMRGAAARGRGRLLRTFAGTLYAMTVLMALILFRLATLPPAPR